MDSSGARGAVARRSAKWLPIAALGAVLLAPLDTRPLAAGNEPREHPPAASVAQDLNDPSLLADTAIRMVAQPPSLRRIAVEPHPPTVPEAAATGRRWTAHLALRSIGASRQLVLSVLSGDVRGTTVLARRGRGRTTLWLFEPATGRVTRRRVDPTEPLLGTGLTLEDLGLLDPGDRVFELAGASDVDGLSAYAVRERDVFGSSDEHFLDWISMDDATLLRRERHDESDLVVRSAAYEQVTYVDAIAVPFFVRFRDAGDDAVTDLRVRDVRFDVHVPKNLFDPGRIEEVASHPAWRHLAPLPPKEPTR